MKHALLFATMLLPALPGWAQAPTISTLSPARNALAVARTAPVQVTLSQPVGASSGALRVFSALRGGRLAGTSTTSGNALVFAPAQAFQPGEVVSVTVPTTVQSSAGTPLAAPHVFQFTTAASGGTGTFGNGGVIPTFTPDQRTAVGDVDGDGDLDLLVVEARFNPVVLGVRLNNGSGLYTVGSSFTVSYLPSDLDLADLDGDGDLDLFISSDGSAASVRLNNGQGVFGAGIAVAVNAYQAVAADLDGDGDLDLAATSAGGGIPGNLSVAMNGGTGSFGAATVVNAGGASKAVAVADVDGDGDLDLLSDDYFSSAVSVRLNNGSGGFGTVILAPVAGYPYIGRVQDLAVGDVDGDGDPDLAVIYDNASNVIICRSNGPSGFGNNATIAVGYRPQSIGLADLDGDGDLDLAVANGQDATMDIRMNNGTGTFAGGATLPIANSTQQVKAGDVDGDGDLDLLVASSSGIQELLNVNSLTPGPALAVTALAPVRNLRNAPRASNVALTFNQPLGNTAAIRAGLSVSSSQRGGRLAGQTTVSGSTLTFDPALDFIPGEQLSVSVTRAVRSSTAAPAQPHVYQFTAAVGGGTGVFGGTGQLPSVTAAPLAVDFDNDGDLDLVNGTSVSINNGGATFSASRSFASNPYTIGKVAMVDLDADGDLDLVSSSTYDLPTSGGFGLIGSNINNGNGTFAPLQFARMGAFAAGLAVGDVDGDGDPDAVAGYDYTKVGVVLNAGNGTFGSLGTREVGIRSSQVLLADMDGDGDLDLVATNGTAIIISRNDGYGTFDAPTTVATSNAGTLAAVDADGDGDLDLLAADGQDLSVRLNNGNATFGSRAALALVSNGGVLTFQNLLVGDVDGDGDIDAVVARAGVGNVGSYSAVMSVCLNDSAGNFGRGSDLVLGTNVTWPAPALLADLDGDGDLDLLASQWSGSMLLRLNQGTPTSRRTGAGTGAQLAVYPNPAHESLTVQLRGATTLPATPLELVNSLGQVVAQPMLNPNSQTAEVVLPIGQLAPGLYLVRLRTNVGVLSKQVVVY
ncbi:FG-GAP-like repeat-containing protein [Hymenobacter sp. DH14]|uniref:FG-GAP-like repeat-containing protein n=1 Tax=Hymenobacter cyanobacteriorum TaxID=2926463 RepID=A0A9X1VPX9_9BACT|nr:FG-GAP-like repeat-containing protein [Hymenobacter cyanobacteriorum]MCI1189926.1 FG-GAP-like repeat-containing protein [Hymenobacter cyanobacteriorum]